MRKLEESGTTIQVTLSKSSGDGVGLGPHRGPISESERKSKQ